jgi:hypothetical protein
VINDISKEGHECHNLNAEEKIVLISHTPDNISLLFADSETGNGITVQLISHSLPSISYSFLDSTSSHNGQHRHEQGQGTSSKTEG